MASSIQEYLRRAEQDPQYAARRETQDIRNALQAISSYQTSKAVGQTLGVDAEAQPKKGVLSFVLDDILGAPARAVKAGVADIIGVNDPELRRQGPLGSAIRGFTGDIDITGGNFIRTRPSDSRLERAAKLAGAFALDVGLDPLTYVGTPAALGRKAASVQAAYGGTKIFKSAAAARAKATGETVESAEKALRGELFYRSSEGRQLAELRRTRSISDKEIADRIAAQGGEQYMQTVAEREIGSLVGESLWAEGRQGILNNLSQEFARTGVISQDAARVMASEVFQELGPRVRGGIFFVNPFTGKEIARVTSGTGESLGQLGVALNKARARIAAKTGRATQSFSGEYGEAFQMIREDVMRYGAGSVANRSMTLSKYVGTKEMRRIEKMVNAGLSKQLLNITSEASLLRQKLGLPDEEFNRLLVEGVLNPNAVLDGAAAEVHAVGIKMAYAMRGLREKLIAAGVEIGDMGDTYLPLVATDNGAAFFDRAGNLVAPRTSVVGATGSGAVGFKTERGRDSFFRNVSNLTDEPWRYGYQVGDNVALRPELANIAVVGEQMRQFVPDGQLDDLNRFFDAKIDQAAAGRWSMPETQVELVSEMKKAGLKVSVNKDDLLSVVLQPFETDMVKIMYKYFSGAAPRIARREMIDAGVKGGVLQVRDAVSAKELTDRVGRQWMSDYVTIAKELQKSPGIARLVADGVLDGDTITAVAMLDEKNLLNIIDNMALDRNLPNTQAQAAVVEEALENVAQMHRVARVSEQQLAIIKGAADSLEQLDDVVSSVDSIIGELVEAGLTPDDIDSLVRSSREVLEKVTVAEPERLLRLFGTPTEQILASRGVLTPADEIAQRFGFERIGAAPDVPGVVAVPAELQEYRTIKGVRALIEERHRVLSNPTRIEKFFKDVYDPAFMVWKTGATVGRGPGYTFLNMVGNLYMNHLGGVGAADHRLAARVIQLSREAAQEAAEAAKAQGLKVAAKDAPMVLAAETDEIFKAKLAELPSVGDKTMYELITDFVNAGGIESSQIGEALNVIRRSGATVTPEALGASGVVRNLFEDAATTRTGRAGQYAVEKLMNNPYQRFANTVNTNIESWTRFAAYIDGYRATQSIDAALDRMFLLQFDYGDLAAGDRMARRVLPFYVWTRNNIPAQIRALFVQPGKIRRFMAAQQTFKDALEADEEDSWMQQILPEYIGEAGGFASRLETADGNNVAFAGKLPYHDVERLFQVGGRFGLVTMNRRELFQMLGPYISLAEMVAGRDFTTGGEFAPEGVEATGWRSVLGALPVVERVGEYGERRIPSGVEKFTSELLPQVGTIERALTGGAELARIAGAPEGVARVIESPASATMRQRGLSNLLNVSGVSPLFGVSATTLTPRTISSSVRGRSRRQRAIIGEAAGRMQVSQEWVRRELQRGFTPEQIAVRIAQGEGRIQDWEAEQDAAQRPPSERYAPILEDLRRGGAVTSLGYNRRESPRSALFGGR